MDIEVSGFGAAAKLEKLLKAYTEPVSCQCKRCMLITITCKKLKAKTDEEVGRIVRVVDAFLNKMEKQK